jgi:competence protein ComEC
LFVIAVLSFVGGLYLQAISPFHLKWPFALLSILILFALFLIRRKQVASLVLIAVCFMLAGMIRLGVASVGYSPPAIGEDKDMYEGLVIEASQQTKIIKLLSPDSSAELKVLFRTPENLSINDKVRIFGQIRELALTFKNPYLTSWKWLKRLEGVSYEIRGALISVSPGRSHIHAWRDFLKRRIEDAGGKYSGVIKALTIGDTTGLDEPTKRLFLETGTSHILAISGSNIGIVTAFFFFLARTFLRRSSVLKLKGEDVRYASALSIPFAFAFMLTAGSSIPTIRATIMITVYMLSLVFQRGRHIINTIALSALVILVAYPHSLFMPTFQLTFTSVLFLAIFTQKFYPLIKIKTKMVKWLANTTLMTASAILGTLPIVIYHFYGINPFSIIHNLIAIPLMCIIAMPLSLVGMLAPHGEHLLRLSGEILDLTTSILNYLNVGYIYPIIRPSLFEVVLYFLLMLSLIYMRRKIILACLISVVIPVMAAHSYQVYERRYHNSLQVNFLDVGLGEAILVEAPAGKRILIDGGGFHGQDYDVGKSVITPILLSKKIRTLDYVVNTHPHVDHVGGLPYILKTFSVKVFATGGYFVDDPRFREILRIIKDRDIGLQLWRSGERVDIEGPTSIMVVSPQAGGLDDDLNNASLVLKLIRGNTSFLFTGDIDSEIEAKLMMSDLPLKSTIMKIPHHGSKGSSSTAFLYAVRPDLAVLSVGPGIRGLPSDEILERYKKLSVPILRTDLNGFIQISSDGEKVTYRTMQ